MSQSEIVQFRERRTMSRPAAKTTAPAYRKNRLMPVRKYFKGNTGFDSMDALSLLRFRCGLVDVCGVSLDVQPAVTAMPPEEQHPVPGGMRTT
jgi:hypothetical protein